MVLSIFLLSGCAHAGTQASSDPTHGTQSGTFGPTPTPSNILPPPLGAPVPKEIFWTNCTKGLVAGTIYDAFSVDPPSMPPGWTPTTQPGFTVQLDGYECGRIGLGDYERGPLRFLIEFHDWESVPPDCELKPGQGFNEIHLRILHSIWVDDAAIAAYLRDVLFMPVHHSPITVSATDHPPLYRDHAWSWGLPGQPQSVLHVLEDLLTPKQDTGGYNVRLYWFKDDTSVSYMDTRMKDMGSRSTDRVANGTMHPPMLFAARGSEFRSPGDWLVDRTLQTTIHRFRDMECREPIE